MPVPDLDPTARRIVAVEIRRRVTLSIGPNSRDILDMGGTVHLTPAEADEAADAAFAALESVGYAVVPVPLIEGIRAQTIRDLAAGRVPLEELAAAQGVEPFTNTADLQGGDPYDQAEMLAFIAALSDCRDEQSCQDGKADHG